LASVGVTLLDERLDTNVVTTKSRTTKRPKTANKPDTPNKRYDTGYKGFFANKSEFLNFLKLVAPQWAKNITIQNLESVPTSFVTNENKPIESDVIYKLKRHGKQEVYFYVLLELQSKVDFTMPFRLLVYMVALLNRIFTDTPEKERKRKGFRLPAIVPIVLYNSPGSWTAVRSFKEYTKDYGIFGDNIINFSYILFDLYRMEECEIKETLDLVFALDKTRPKTDDECSKDEYSKKMIAMVLKYLPKLPKDGQNSLFQWLSTTAFSGITPAELKETFMKHNKGGIMKHAVEEILGKLIEETAEKRVVQVAKNLLKSGDSAEKVADVTGLDISIVLKLKATRSKPTVTSPKNAKASVTVARRRTAAHVRHT